MSILGRIPQHLMAQARSLDDIGIAELAWNMDVIEDVLHALKGADVAVLGGDVYEEIGEALRPSDDNWYCERHVGEQFTAYSYRSQETARAYIRRRIRLGCPGCYFTLVLSDDPTAGW